MTRRSVYGTRAVALALLGAALSGCGFNLVDLGPPPSLYDMQPDPVITEYPARLPWQLIVEEPTAVAALDTDRIIVRPSAYEVKYYAGARWTDRAPLIVQEGLVEAFERTRTLGVGRQEIGLRGDYNLKGELRAFESVIGPGETVPTVRVRLNLKVVRQPAAVIVASRTIERERQAASGSIVSVVDAFQDAVSAILEEAVDWTLSEADEDFRSLPGKRPVRTGERRIGRPAGEDVRSLTQAPETDIGMPPAAPEDTPTVRAQPAVRP